MESLVRTRVADFRLDDAKTLSQIEAMRDAGTLGQAVIAVDTLFPSYPAFFTAEGARKRLYNGNPMKPEELSPEWDCLSEAARKCFGEAEDCISSGMVREFPERIRIYDDKKQFVGIYSYDRKWRFYRPQTLFFTEQAAAKEQS